MAVVPVASAFSAAGGYSGLQAETLVIAGCAATGAGGAGGAAGAGAGAIVTGAGGGATVVVVIAGAGVGGGATTTSGGGTKLGGGGANLGGGGGRFSGGGGGGFTSSMILVSIGFLITSTTLRASPVTSAQPIRMCNRMTIPKPTTCLPGLRCCSA